MAVERRTLWLGSALIVAVVALVVVRTMSDPAASTPRRGSAAPRSAARAGAQAPADAPADVNLALLSRERGEPADATRNPFRFQPKSAPSAPPPPTPAETAPPDITESVARPSIPSGPPPPPPITLKFIGLVQKVDGTRIAVLSDGKRPFYGVEGQEIEGQYKILKVGQESLEIAYIDGRGRQTLRLTGQ